jgi:hypothetical protein
MKTAQTYGNRDRIRLDGIAAVLMAAVLAGVGPARAGESPRLFLHQNYVEETQRTTDLPVDNILDMFAWVLGNLPERVNVYPTENYYYFRFMHNGQNYAGNIRLDARDRDEGKVHFAYFEDMQEYRVDPPMQYRPLDQTAGVKVEKVEKLRYRISFRDKSVLFELNDLSNVRPPPNAMTADEIYIGPVFDDSAIRFFLVFNQRLKIFHYVLDETVKVNDDFFSMPETDSIMIGKRTGFAFYRDPRRNREILIGVFEPSARINNYFDGPFDQLPDNFIEGDVLQRALIESQPLLEGKIGRLGHFDDGSRVAITPYGYYRTPSDLLIFHTCATDSNVPAELYYACFVMDWTSDDPGLVAYKRMINAAAPNAAPAEGTAARTGTSGAETPAAHN